MTLEGGCRCGQVRYRTEAAPFNQTICHCLDCRRSAGAPMVAWFTVPPDTLAFTGEPRIHASSPGITRGFCPNCGTTLTYQRRPDEIDVTTASLDQPDDHPPVDHTMTAGQLSWVKLADGLPRHPQLRSVPSKP